MKQFLAFVVSALLAPICLMLGTALVGFIVALSLTWTPGRIRAVLAATIGGIGGVATSVGVGYLIFYLILGPKGFGLASLLVSTIPLAIPILREFNKARTVAALQRDFQDGLPSEIKNMTAPMSDGVIFSVVGWILGIVLSFSWFFFAYKFR